MFDNGIKKCPICRFFIGHVLPGPNDQQIYETLDQYLDRIRNNNIHICREILRIRRNRRRNSFSRYILNEFDNLLHLFQFKTPTYI